MKKACIVYLFVIAMAFSLCGCSLDDTMSSITKGDSKEQSEKDTSKNHDGQNDETAGEEELAGGLAMSAEEARKLAEEKLTTMTLQEKVCQMFVVNLELLDTRKGSFYEYRKCTKQMKKMLADYPVGGVVLFSRNIENRQQTQKLIGKLQENSSTPLFVCVDEEGGIVSRIASNPEMGTTVFPTMEEIGREEDAEYAYQMGETIGKEIKELGFNVDFAPVADVKTNESNTEIGSRSFGDDPDKVSEMVVSVVEGLQSQGVSATLKHFPGHGDASSDSHEGSVNVDNSIMRMRKIDFVPFQNGIDAGVDFVMISHISISRVTESTTPASLSSLIMRDILRGELGFEGVIITDALNMHSITDDYTEEETVYMAVRGGADLLLMPMNLENSVNILIQKVESGDIDERLVDDAVLRILEVKYKRGILPAE